MTEQTCHSGRPKTQKDIFCALGQVNDVGKDSEFNGTTGIIRRLNCYSSNNSLLSVNASKSRAFAFMDKWLVIAALSPCQGGYH